MCVCVCVFVGITIGNAFSSTEYLGHLRIIMITLRIPTRPINLPGILGHL